MELTAALDGLLLMFSAKTFLFMIIGIVIGMFFGLVPGLSGLSGVTLLLPVALGQPAEVAFPFLLGLYAVTSQTDTIPAVLIGVPGTASAQATVLDGYPMSKRGEANRALSASYFASIWGSMVAGIIFIAFLPVLRTLIDAFASPEFFMMAVLGLALAGSLSGASLTRGITMAALGLMVSAIGIAPNSDVERFSFEWDYLIEGVPLVPIILGIFAVPEVIDLLRKNVSIATEDRSGGGERGGRIEGALDVVRNWWLLVRCATIGTVCGMVPGLGGIVAEWLGYGHAVQSAKDPSQFGKGDVRGIMAPEAATAAQKPGGILPTVAFGIPGNPAMAVMLGVFLIVGLVPGPAMLNEKLDLTFLMVWVTIAANIIAALFALVLQRWLVRVCYLPAAIIAPVILVFMVIGATMATRNFADLLIFGIFGFLGYVFKHTDWPRVPLLMGVVLGDLAERNFFIAHSRWGFEWIWQRPITVIIIVLTVVSVSLLARRRTKKKPAGRTYRPAETRR